MAKTLNTSSKRLKGSTKVIHSIAPEHIERKRFFEAAMNEERALHLANEMIEWGETNLNALFENDFLVLKKISQKTWQMWKRKYEVLQEASDYLKTLFAARRESIAIKQDQKFLSSSMHLYSALFEDDKTLDHERKKELKNIAEKHNNMDNIREVIKQILEPIV
jgi:hypothetical protein